MKLILKLGDELITGTEICNYRGYVKLNRTKFEKDLQDLKRGLEKKLRGKPESMIPDQEEVSQSFLVSREPLITLSDPKELSSYMLWQLHNRTF
ncbi:hypothetical protein TELCIR_16159 [Teladorsagia circumcincta]|uniref:Uncharacterized protein n=1 Tax=Teladorsagia circumcincta TaxID=45464 RepID=A0A2G9TYH8_TELCI|nr:hypothetical protein TELCIR_16159 [Teladorsagia circumcincta]